MAINKTATSSMGGFDALDIEGISSSEYAFSMFHTYGEYMSFEIGGVKIKATPKQIASLTDSLIRTFIDESSRDNIKEISNNSLLQTFKKIGEWFTESEFAEENEYGIRGVVQDD